MSGKGRVLVAMSGGVDSSVALRLLVDQGYDCIGVTMRLYDQERDTPGHKTCCSLSDVQDAKAVAYSMGVPHYTIDCTGEFERRVIDGFVRGYEAGETPNPCIACNRHMKFGVLLKRAAQLGCGHVATGHYAQVTCDAGAYRLRRGVDEAKDQSYMLSVLGQDALAHVLLPLGGMTKEEVREAARKAGFANAEKEESEDICFVPDGDYASFIERRTGHAEPAGDFVDRDGAVIGRHKGLVRYTVGQRKGLGVSVGHPLYVVRKDASRNQVVLGSRDELARPGFDVRDVTWTDVAFADQAQGKGGMACDVVTRYHGAPHEGRVTAAGGAVHVEFERPQEQVAPGQQAVFYRRDPEGDVVMGGGTIA